MFSNKSNFRIIFSGFILAIIINSLLFNYQNFITLFFWLIHLNISILTYNNCLIIIIYY
jgi:hypothetical protein